MRSLSELFAVVSVLSFYTGAGVTWLSRVAGTCTQGDADRLFGVALSIAIYSVALITMPVSGRVRTISLFISPLAPVFLWQVWFSSRLAFEIVVLDRSACSVLEGAIPGYPMSGNEANFALLWPLMSFGVLLALLAILIVSETRLSQRQT